MLGDDVALSAASQANGIPPLVDADGWASREGLMPRPAVFLSYRREDSEQATRNIYKEFAEAGNQRVFMDLAEINSGERWPKRIEDELGAADVVIVVIGDTWLSCHDADGRRRIDHPDDRVAWELRLAMNGAKKIVPVLVGRADMPSASSLPEDLQDLVSFQAKRLSSANWQDDARALVSSVEEIKAVEARPKAT